jgi:hypothetical protein
VQKIEACLAEMEFGRQEVEHRKIAEESSRGESSEAEQDEFWADKVRRLKMQGCSEEVIRESCKNIPYPGAFREIAIAIRKDIRARRKENLKATDLLLQLYHWAVIENFFSRVEWSKIINERILHSTARLSIKGIKTPYETIGYANLALLNRTDVKWLVETFGEPASHLTAEDANSDLCQQAVEAFQAAAERDEQHFWRSQGFDRPP